MTGQACNLAEDMVVTPSKIFFKDFCVTLFKLLFCMKVMFRTNQYVLIKLPLIFIRFALLARKAQKKNITTEVF